MRNDGLVISGTTGESPTTTDAEKDRLLRAVIEAVGDRATIVAGVGTNDTAHTCELARQAERAGARRTARRHAVLQQAAAERPGRALHRRRRRDRAAGACSTTSPAAPATPIATETLIQLAQHPRIVAVKDAKGDFGATSKVMLATDLVFYSGDDMLNLPWLSVGAAGFVSVVGHVVGDRLHDMIDAYLAGRVGEARQIHRELLPRLHRDHDPHPGRDHGQGRAGPAGAARRPGPRPADRRHAGTDRTVAHRPGGGGGVKLPGGAA